MTDMPRVPPAERRARRWRLAIIIAVAFLLIAGGRFAAYRRSQDNADADAKATQVANELRTKMAGLGVAAVFDATSSNLVEHTAPTEFPGRPRIDGAEIWGVSSTPEQLSLTYHFSEHRLDRCVTGTLRIGGVVTVATTDCVAK